MPRFVPENKTPAFLPYLFIFFFKELAFSHFLGLLYSWITLRKMLLCLKALRLALSSVVEGHVVLPYKDVNLFRLSKESKAMATEHLAVSAYLTSLRVV